MTLSLALFSLIVLLALAAITTSGVRTLRHGRGAPSSDSDLKRKLVVSSLNRPSTSG